jgi:galactitol-specific phosphotransferase system IIB component
MGITNEQKKEKLRKEIEIVKEDLVEAKIKGYDLFIERSDLKCNIECIEEEIEGHTIFVRGLASELAQLEHKLLQLE